MGIKDFFIKKAVQSQLKNVPKDQQEMIMKLVEENPELFASISKEVKALTKSGKSEMVAMMEVMKKYQGDIQKAMGGPVQQQRPF